MILTVVLCVTCLPDSLRLLEAPRLRRRNGRRAIGGCLLGIHSDRHGGRGDPAPVDTRRGESRARQQYPGRLRGDLPGRDRHARLVHPDNRPQADAHQPSRGGCQAARRNRGERRNRRRGRVRGLSPVKSGSPSTTPPGPGAATKAGREAGSFGSSLAGEGAGARRRRKATMRSVPPTCSAPSSRWERTTRFPIGRSWIAPISSTTA